MLLASFTLDRQSPIFNSINLEKDEYIYVEDNQHRYMKLVFERFRISDLVQKYKIEDDRFFCFIPIEGFQVFNKSTYYEALKEHFIECGFQIISKEEIKKKLLDKSGKKMHEEGIVENLDERKFSFPEDIKGYPVEVVFSENKEAHFIRYCNFKNIELIEDITPQILTEFNQFKGVSQTKYQLICSKVHSLLSGTYAVKETEITQSGNELWEAILSYNLGGNQVSNLFEGRFLEYCQSMNKMYLSDIQEEIQNDFNGITGVGTIKRNAVKQILIECIESEKKKFNMLDNYIIDILEDRYKLIKDKTVQEVQSMLRICIPSIENMTFGMLQGKHITEIGNQNDRTGIIKLINTINQLMTMDELFKEVKSILEEREIEILNCRYDMGYTLEECGKIYGLTRERVRQIEMKTITKLLKYMKENHLIVCMSFQFGLQKYVTVNEIMKHISPEHLGLLQAYLHKQDEVGRILGLELLCLDGKKEINELCLEIEEYLGEIFRFDEEEDLLLEMFHSIGATNINTEGLQQYLLSLGFHDYGYFYSKHRLSLKKMYSIVLRDEITEPLTLDESGVILMKIKLKELFHQELNCDTRVIEARLADCEEVLSVANKTYLHVNHIDITQEMVENVERVIEEQLNQFEVIQSGEVYRIHQQDLNRINIANKYFFYTIAKRYLTDKYRFGKRNTMSITRIENAEGFYQTREEILIEKLRENHGKMKKRDILNSTNWEWNKIEDVLNKSEEMISIGKYAWLVNEFNVESRVEELIMDSALRYYQRDKYVITQKVYKETVVDPQVFQFYKSFEIMDGKAIAGYIKHLIPKLKGHSTFLSSLDSGITSIVDIITMKFKERCSKREIQQYLLDFGYKEAATYALLCQLISNNIYYQVDSDEFITKEEFEHIFEQVHDRVKCVIDERIGAKEYLILNNIAPSLRRELPRIDHRWSPELIYSIIIQQGYRGIEKEFSDYRTDRKIVVKEDSPIFRFDQLVYYILKNEYDGIMHESYICNDLMEHGVIFNTDSSLRKLPIEIRKSKLFEIDELGRLSIKEGVYELSRTESKI